MEGNSVANTTNSSSSLSTTTSSSSPTLSTPATEITPQAANLQLHDLLCPTEKAQSLLETLTPEQITLIEQTLQRIREKKSQMTTPGKRYRHPRFKICNHINLLCSTFASYDASF